MDYARSNTAIIDSPSVNIEICTLSGNLTSRLQLDYHGQRYDLVQAFASHKLELAQQRWQQQIEVDTSAPSSHSEKRLRERYLLVREIGYYSLWALDQSVNLASTNSGSNHKLELQQASIWLFQELWLQWQDFLGERQLQVFAENLLGVNSLLKSRANLDRLLSLDPLASEQLDHWERADFIKFDRQLWDLTQKKMGQKFGRKLTIDIIESMPDSFRTILIDILDPKTQLDIPQHD
jgi:hypothetical protein